MAKYQSVDEYMATLPAERRAAMEQLRQAIREAAPRATEVIAYNMPAFRLDGQFFMSFEAYKKHYSVFPWTDRMIEALGDELKRYATGKGTIQFPADEPIPVDLVKRLVQVRLAEFPRLDEVSGR
jgi:uncharacterized protein YdhG (YjbR/CyaY superfamily)